VLAPALAAPGVVEAPGAVEAPDNAVEAPDVADAGAPPPPALEGLPGAHALSKSGTPALPAAAARRMNPLRVVENDASGSVRPTCAMPPRLSALSDSISYQAEGRTTDPVLSQKGNRFLRRSHRPDTMNARP
jgi:hypothetical protein